MFYGRELTIQEQWLGCVVMNSSLVILTEDIHTKRK